MEIPKKVKVAGIEYEVKLDTPQLEESNLQGVHNAGNCSIHLRTHHVDLQRIEAVFIHELLHAIDEEYNDGALDEKQIMRLANGIYQVFKDNKIWKN